MKNLPTPGSVRGLRNPHAKLDTYVIVTDIPASMLIGGHRHKKHDSVKLAAEEARHWLLEGIIERVADTVAETAE